MKKQIVILSLALMALTGQAQAQFDDPLPWPWGSECQFPWSQLTGLWQVTNTDAGGYFYFQIDNQLDRSDKPLLRIWRYTPEGVLQFYGHTYVDWSERIIQVTLVPAWDSVVSYEMILRSYPNPSVGEAGPGSCFSQGGQVMVFTLRKTVEEKVYDLHYRLSRIRFRPLGG